MRDQIRDNRNEMRDQTTDNRNIQIKADNEDEVNEMTDQMTDNEAKVGCLGFDEEENLLIQVGDTVSVEEEAMDVRDLMETLGVLGAVLMGEKFVFDSISMRNLYSSAGIFQVCDDKGVSIVMKDAKDAGLACGIGQVQNGLETGVKGTRITALERDQILANLLSIQESQYGD
uniref:Uncharacterized protein n=1 Tax=Glossina morsitans morsitans TaxID=37546 RepID=A0A1B0GDA5_GLOMM